MDIIALFAGFAVPWMLGLALVLALRRDSVFDRAGALAWVVGCSWFVGAFLLTLWMRALSAAGIPFSVTVIAGPLAALALVVAWLVWRSGKRAARVVPGRVLRALAGVDLAGWRRIAWYALLAWLTLRFALLLGEVIWRPLLPWDAWAHWASKARVWFEMKSMVPFVGGAEWMQQNGRAYTDANPHYPATVPLLQVWGALLLGQWDDALINLPWWLTGVALALAIYGFLAQRGFDALWSLTGAWLVVSLPILDAHIALAGYADLPMASYLTLAVLAGLRWTEQRDRDDAVLSLLFVAACVLVKVPGKIWVLIMLPGFVAAMVPRFGVRLAMAGLGAAIAVLVVLARLDLLVLGYRFHLDFVLPWRGLVDAYLLFANWHLLWYGALAIAILKWRQLVSPDVAPLTLVVMTGLLLLFFGFAFTNANVWVEDQSTVNRATLHLAPLLVVWMLLVLRTGAAPAAAATAAESAEDAVPASPEQASVEPAPTMATQANP